MFIVSAKLPRRSLLLSAGAAVLLCCAVLTAVSAIPAARQASAALPDGKGIRSNEDRLAYLQSYGWQLSEEPVSTEELLIPEEMDESYTDYLALQEGQGFNLRKYAGKRVKRYTYEITNYPTGEPEVIVNLLLYKNTAVGGEVLSNRPGGFLHGLAMP